MIAVCHLNPGDLFTCDIGAMKGYLYRFSHNEPEEGPIERSMAETVMFFMDGVWHSQTPTMQNWNHCCHVTPVRLEVVPK